MFGEDGSDLIDARDYQTSSWLWGWDASVGGEGVDTIWSRDGKVDLVFGRHMGDWPYGGSVPDNIDVCVMDAASIDLNYCRWSS